MFGVKNDITDFAALILNLFIFNFCQNCLSCIHRCYRSAMLNRWSTLFKKTKGLEKLRRAQRVTESDGCGRGSGINKS